MSGLWWKSLLVAVISFAFFAYGVGQAGVASALTNNVDRVYAQDESVYTNVALHMAAHGNWLTPIFLGRIFLYKPPMLHALAGLSLKALGISLFALRLPSLLAASLAVALLFAWSTRERGLWAGIAVVLLLISNVLWVTFARLCYTDMLQASFTVAAMFWLARDPRLERASTRLIFSAVCAAAILSKSAAGVLPLLALGLYAFAGPREARPTIQRVAGTTAWTALFLAPWYVYQLAVHGQWFWTDYVRVQLLNFGTESSLSGSKEVPLLFYLKRLFLIDPFLCIGAVLAVPGFIVGMRLRKPEVRLLACWVFVVLAGLSAFQYRNFYYVLMLIAPLCLAIPYCLPARSVRWLTLVLALVFGLKVTASDRVWSLSYYASRPLAAAPWLRSYADRLRSNELILVDTDDEFYSAVLPLPKVRYCFRDPANLTVRYAPYYVHLGITVTSDVFVDLARWEPLFRERLRAWGLDSGEPIATAIVARNNADVVNVIRTHPDTDFYLPADLESAARAAAQKTHTYVAASASRFFLFANRSTPRDRARSSMLQ